MKKKTILNCPTCSEKIRVPVGKHIKFTCPKCKDELEFDDNVPTDDNEETTKSFGDRVINIFSWAIIIPTFITLHKILPNIDWHFNLDRILLGVVSFFLVRLLLHYIRTIVLVAISLAILSLSYGSLWGNYGFVNVYKDYRAMIYMMAKSPSSNHLTISKLQPFVNSDKIESAIDFKNPIVRNFALEATRKHFSYEAQHSEYRQIIQAFAIFKEIKNNWNYVNDPQNQEYFAKASELPLYRKNSILG